jgi:hypothetical protein
MSRMKLGLRDLFWLLLVVAMAMGWWCDVYQRDLRSFERIRAERDYLMQLVNPQKIRFTFFVHEGKIVGHSRSGILPRFPERSN